MNDMLLYKFGVKPVSFYKIQQPPNILSLFCMYINFVNMMYAILLEKERDLDVLFYK